VITVRPAVPSDEALLLRWANDPVVREQSFHPEPIDPATHHEWLRSRLSSAATLLLIGEEDGRPIGQVRFERGDDEVEVGIAVAREARGRGVGRALLAKALDHAAREAVFGTARWLAMIRPANRASIALFAGAGFRHAGPATRNGLPAVRYELSRRGSAARP
jgi:RimJ/RimL family protein N-acetyltransferase